MPTYAVLEHFYAVLEQGGVTNQGLYNAKCLVF